MAGGSLFGTSGVRRRIEELPQDFVEDLGKAVGSHTQADTVALGRDTRSSGPKMQQTLQNGILSTGKNIVDCGLVPTPTLGVAAAEHGCAVMVTASHNPPDYNGFKLWDGTGAYRPEQEKEVEELFHSKKFRTGEPGKVTSEDVIQKHIELIRKRIPGAEGVKVLVDCAGGAGSTITPRLLEELGCIVTAINTNQDGVFPHPLEPTAENLAETCAIVAQGHYDLGLVHDGDADRTAAIDMNGNLIDWDRFLGVLAWGKHRIVTTVDASMALQDICNKVVITPVGDVAVAAAIRKYDASFGGEPSGTFIFPDIHLYPDGVATAAKAVELVSQGIFYEILDEIPAYPMDRLKIECPDEDKEAVMEKIKEILGDKEEFFDIDGIKIEREACWILIRPSGTEPFIRATGEGATPEDLAKIMTQASNWVNKAIGAVRSEKKTGKSKVFGQGKAKASEKDDAGGKNGGNPASPQDTASEDGNNPEIGVPRSGLKGNVQVPKESGEDPVEKSASDGEHSNTGI